MKALSVMVLVALLLVTLTASWAGVVSTDIVRKNFDSLGTVPETVRILISGMVLLALTSVMRVRTAR